ncbi:MAG: hypothetical protein GY841_02815 [FCB group bacterium]|nr:hypothetical protein [FCB group bacterium]
MMAWPKKLFPIALIALVTMVASASGADASVTGPNVTRSGNLAVFQIVNAPAEHDVVYFPVASRNCFHRCGNEIIFASRETCRVWIILLSKTSDGVKTFVFDFDNAEDGPVPPIPTPYPNPDPTPTPDPLPQPGKRNIVLIRETEDQTPALAQQIAAIRSANAIEDHELWIMDPSQKSCDPFTEILDGDPSRDDDNVKLPALILTDFKTNKLLFKGELPLTAEATLSLIKRKGG